MLEQIQMSISSKQDEVNMKEPFDKKIAIGNFERLRITVIEQRRQFLKQFTYEQLLDYASNQDVKHWLIDIYLKTTRRIAPDKAGMKTNPKAVWTKNHIPLAITAILNRDEKVTNEAIKNELDKFKDSIDPTDKHGSRKMYTENGIKTALAEFNKDADKWLIDNKQLDDG